MEEKDYKELIIRIDLRLMGLIRDAMASTKIFNRSEFLRLIIETGCNEILNKK